MDFKGKVVLITGASGGMGEAIARQLSREGCNLAFFARREEKLKKISEEIVSDKTKCIYKKCDVTNKQNVEEAVKFTHENFGRIDIAILNAGVLIPNPIETMDSSIIVNTMKINFFGAVYFLESLFPIMKKQESATIAVTSTLPDKRGIPGWGAYGASKAAISWLMESLRAEAKQKYNINIITIKPGSVKTPMIKNYHRPGAISPELAANIIIKGIKKEKKVIQFPTSQVIMTRIGDLLPPSAYDAVPIDMQKGEGYPVVEE
jgi:NAD(P)-dependent dehydrogenase (short-subunit alcohol dehydrogenase family)